MKDSNYTISCHIGHFDDDTGIILFNYEAYAVNINVLMFHKLYSWVWKLQI